MDYVLGIDGLPLGNWAAVASGPTSARSIRSLFIVADADGQALSLEARVQAALARTEAETGLLPLEVRLVCYDDGDDGRTLAAIAAWLTSHGSVPLRVLTPAPGDPDDLLGDSVGRARYAALQ